MNSHSVLGSVPLRGHFAAAVYKTSQHVKKATEQRGRGGGGEGGTAADRLAALISSAVMFQGSGVFSFGDQLFLRIKKAFLSACRLLFLCPLRAHTQMLSLLTLCRLFPGIPRVLFWEERVRTVPAGG